MVFGTKKYNTGYNDNKIDNIIIYRVLSILFIL